MTCDPNINCIIGKNGVGKTNFLDSIYYLAFCKSNLLPQDNLNVHYNERSFLLQGTFREEKNTHKVVCSYSSEEKEKRVSCNDKKYSRFSDHIGLIPLIFISPADITLINESGSERRRFIDSYIAQYDKEYLQHLLHYNKILTQRNAILKQSQKIDYTYLEVLDVKLQNFAESIFKTRTQVVAELAEQAITFYKQIHQYDECEISYESQLQKGNLRDLLQGSFERDCILGHTSIGIHRDDIIFSFNGGLLKQSGSQGQKKSFLLALKFAQYQSLYQKKQMHPILLLDDLFDKLDAERTKKVFEIIEGQEFGQIFITDTDKALLEAFISQKQYSGTFWKLENGNMIAG